MPNASRHPRALLLGLGTSLALALLFNLTRLDLDWQGLAYRALPGGPDWPLGDRQPWRALYLYGTLPGLLAAVAAALALGASWVSPRWRAWRWPAAFLVACLALGPGLLINGFGKALAGRPRPEDVTLFGGAWDYLPPFILGTPGKGRSFLCGHCSMGFYFLAFSFVFTGWKRWAAWGLGLALGLGLGLARVLQGGHFPSDVLLAGSLSYTLFALLSPLASREPGTEPVLQGPRAWAAAGALGGLLVFGFLFSTPVYEEQRWVWLPQASMRPKAGPTERILALEQGSRCFVLTADKGDLEASFGRGEIMVGSLTRGFGFPNARARLKPLGGPGGACFGLEQRLTGWFAESKASFRLRLPDDLDAVDLATSGRATLDLSGLARPLELTLPASLAGPAGFGSDKLGHWSRPGMGSLLRIRLRADSLTLR